MDNEKQHVCVATFRNKGRPSQQEEGQRIRLGKEENQRKRNLACIPVPTNRKITYFEHIFLFANLPNQRGVGLSLDPGSPETSSRSDECWSLEVTVIPWEYVRAKCRWMNTGTIAPVNYEPWMGNLGRKAYVSVLFF